MTENLLHFSKLKGDAFVEFGEIIVKKSLGNEFMRVQISQFFATFIVYSKCSWICVQKCPFNKENSTF